MGTCKHCGAEIYTINGGDKCADRGECMQRCQRNAGHAALRHFAEADQICLDHGAEPCARLRSIDVFVFLEESGLGRKMLTQ